MSLGLLTYLILGWTVLLVVWNLAFIISAVNVMIDSYYSRHVMEYIQQNWNNHWVKVMVTSFVVTTILLLVAFIGLAFLP